LCFGNVCECAGKHLTKVQSPRPPARPSVSASVSEGHRPSAHPSSDSSVCHVMLGGTAASATGSRPTRCPTPAGAAPTGRPGPLLRPPPRRDDQGAGSSFTEMKSLSTPTMQTLNNMNMCVPDILQGRVTSFSETGKARNSSYGTRRTRSGRRRRLPRGAAGGRPATGSRGAPARTGGGGAAAGCAAGGGGASEFGRPSITAGGPSSASGAAAARRARTARTRASSKRRRSGPGHPILKKCLGKKLRGYVGNKCIHANMRTTGVNKYEAPISLTLCYSGR
jgi:hypothetical protein